jgi:glycosyltransferase involved in cell wall biosynthesis
MKVNATNKPLVSVMLPLAPDADPDLLDMCLRSISAQTYQEIETLVLLSDGSSPELEHIISQFPQVRTFHGSFTKSAARNFLAHQSKGEYMLYIDVDMELSRNLLEECINLAMEKGSQAIITTQKEAPTRSFWGKCRSLEWDLLSDDIGSASPYFLLTSTFTEVGGFDESIDMWDDWVLSLRLMSKGIRFDRVQSPIFIRDTTDLGEMFARKYKRGRFIPALLQKYPNAPYVKFFDRFIRIYVRNWKSLLRSPILAVGLAFLKVLDIVALYAGRFNPVKNIPGDGTEPYFQSNVAESYDQVRLYDGFNLYKHYSETRSLRLLLRHVNSPLVEIGCGTGRMTRELMDNGFHILPIDPSPAMLHEFRKKTDLPNPIRADGMSLPFAANVVEGVFSLRVIWHLPTLRHLEQIVEEMARISMDYVILDISNERRWRHPLLRPLIAIYFRFNPRELSKHETSILLTIERFTYLVEQMGLQVDHILALDVLSPIWLKPLPLGFAKLFYPIIFHLESIFSVIIPPGRYLIRLTKNPLSDRSIPDRL